MIAPGVRCGRALAALVAVTIALGGCGGDDDGDESATPTDVSTSTADEASTPDGTPSDGTSDDADDESSSPDDGATEDPTDYPTDDPTDGSATQQPAVWPAAGVVFDDPTATATDFVSSVLGVEPTLGPFMQGDSRSGEIEVLPPPEASTAPVRSVLLLRQLGPSDGWFVLAAVSGTNTIETPAQGGTVEAGPVQVSGVGRGFEGTLVVEAFVAGSTDLLAQQVTAGGSMADTEPYTTTVDLSDAASGDTVLLLVRGGVGLETDTGEFSAIALVVD